MYRSRFDKKIRSEIFVPLAVGGGIKNIEEVSSIINEGVEKVIINSENFSNTDLISQIAKKFDHKVQLYQLM